MDAVGSFRAGLRTRRFLSTPQAARPARLPPPLRKQEGARRIGAVIREPAAERPETAVRDTRYRAQAGGTAARTLAANVSKSQPPSRAGQIPIASGSETGGSRGLSARADRSCSRVWA